MRKQIVLVAAIFLALHLQAQKKTLPKPVFHSK